MRKYIVTVSTEKKHHVIAENERAAIAKIKSEETKDTRPDEPEVKNMPAFKPQKPDDEAADYCCGNCDKCKPVAKEKCDLFFEFMEDMLDDEPDNYDIDALLNERILFIIDAIDDLIDELRSYKNRTCRT